MRSFDTMVSVFAQQLEDRQNFSVMMLVWLVGWLVVCLVVWLFGCLVVWLVGCLVVWLVVWLVACLFGRTDHLKRSFNES